MPAPRRFLPSMSSLRALEALDRLGSASAVATDLNLTQSAVSRQLQALERQMGMELIHRDSKRLTLTPAAAEYAAEIRQALNRITQASLRLQMSPMGGPLNLAILPTFGMRWLMPRLPGFSRLHPDVTINMTTRLERFSFAEEPFDAALHFGDAQWPDTHSLLLRQEQVIAVCAPGLLADGSVRRAADILTLPLLHIHTRPRAWADWLTFHGVPVPPQIAGTIYDQFSTITQAALHELGVALLPDYLIETELATRRLVPVFGPAIEARGAYHLVWPRSKAQNPSLTLFRDWLATQAQPEDPLPR